MKKVTVIIIVAIVAVIAVWAVNGYNSLVGMDEGVSNQWANVETQYQLATALGKLLAITENYPDLKANQNFLELQAQLEGTENRINVARKNFNDAARAYNTAIRRFPKNILAGLFGFDKRAYFEAQDGAETAPTVEF